MLACTAADVPYADYVPVWWETGVVTYQIMNAAPAWAVRELAQAYCPRILTPLERFLERPRHVDPLWALHQELIPHREYVYHHFFETLLSACSAVWPQLAPWPTLDAERQFQVLQIWLWLSDAQQGKQWTEETTEEQKLGDLKAILLHRYEEYRRDVLHNEWHPPMTYPYRDNPAYFLQPSGWGVQGPLTTGPDGGGMRLEPEDDSKAAWQRHCGRVLAERWAQEIGPQAGEVDLDAWLQGEGEDDADLA
jgi:hypothetical protein